MALTLGKNKTGGEPLAETPAGDPVNLSKKAYAEYHRPFTVRSAVVNLLSPELKELLEQQRLKRGFVVVALGLVSLLVVGWLAQSGFIGAAERRLEAEQLTAQSLAQEGAKLAPIRSFYGQIESNAATIKSTMSSEVLTSDVISSLYGATPAGVNIDTLGLTLSVAAEGGAVDPAAASTCPSQDPYQSSGPTAGCISVSGSGASRALLGAWLDSIEAHPLFTVAFIPSTNVDAGSGLVSFTATIGLDATKVFKGRYANPEFLKGSAN